MKKSLLISYTFILVIFAIFSYVFVDPNLLYFKGVYSGFAVENRMLTTVAYIAFICTFFIFYFFFLHLQRKNKLKSNDLKFLIGASVGILLFSYPAMLSYDIFNYITTSKVLFFYNENPYLIMPIEFTKDPFLSFTHGANKIALYGPVWVLLIAIPYVLSFGFFFILVLNFKLLITLFYLGILLLLWKLNKDWFTVSFFALNPLVLIETFVSSHNDVAMMFFALFSFFLLFNKKVFLSFIFLLLSISIKYATVFLLPVFCYSAWKVLQKEEIKKEKIFYFSFLSMLTIFLLSPLREEMYSWYAIWFLLFASLVLRRKLILFVCFVFSFSLLLRYIPFMLLGTHFGPTPIIKITLTWLPVSLGLILYLLKKKYKFLKLKG